ncbi:hypothetical protein BKA93DRAFT_749616 [Sparassis latifolia]
MHVIICIPCTVFIPHVIQGLALSRWSLLLEFLRSYVSKTAAWVCRPIGPDPWYGVVARYGKLVIPRLFPSGGGPLHYPEFLARSAKRVPKIFLPMRRREHLILNLLADGKSTPSRMKASNPCFSTRTSTRCRTVVR